MGDDARRLRIGADRQTLGRSSNDHLRRHRNAIDGNNDVDAVVVVVSGKSQRRNRSIRCCNALHWRNVELAKERWCEAEVHRIAGEIALKSPKPDPAKAEAYFERALGFARAQQAKSWELRAAMSMARLWGGLGKQNEARELLAPVYGWFTEGFDTRDLKEAKTLLDALAAEAIEKAGDFRAWQ